MHQIVFRNVENGWHNALPLGNGRMGAMVFFEGRTLRIALNHYDCYYGVLPGADAETEGEKKTFSDPARYVRTYEELCALTEEAKRRPDYGRSHYARTLQTASVSGRPSYRGTSYPMGGELLLRLDDRVDVNHTCLKLEIEKGRVCFSAGNTERAEASVIVPKTGDGALIRLSQTEDGLWRSAELCIPSEIGLGYCRTEKLESEQFIGIRTAYRPEGGGDALFIQETAALASGARVAKGGEGLELPADFRRITVAAATAPGEGTAAKRTASMLDSADRQEKEHGEAWQRFFCSTVSLPDYFLETLWHLHLYLMGCSYATGGLHPEQACGLNGLWDIRRPNMWGSMWYWDVNIQSAFWGSASAGHTELLKVFCDGYLSYEQDILSYTKRVYKAEGWALDYPHPLYNCIQPWCAGVLWDYFTYTGDMDFLEKKAYPVFRKQIAFFERLAKRDENGVLHMEPDISPEQGPVTKDSVITVACLKKLLRAAVRSAELLKRPVSEREEMERLLSHMPEYSGSGEGMGWRDSALAKDGLFLRHPSVLMPVFPAQEVTARSGPKLRKRGEETLRYAAEHTEIGTFGPGWLAASAAVLGKGDEAVRLLYEKGLEHTLHSNGLCYEESERFINYCHVTKPAHYLPAMCEASGGIVVTVNRMLLRGEDVIEIFPALPEGKEDAGSEKPQYREDEPAIKRKTVSWRNVSFEGLMAPGGFRVSSRRREGRTVYLKVESAREADLRLLLPGELAGETQLFEKRMKPGESLVWGETDGIETAEERPEVQMHEAASFRRVFLGEDRHTAFYKAVDAFTCGYCLAGKMQYEMTPYIFDFGRTDTEKTYDDVYHRQVFLLQQAVLHCAGPTRAGAALYDGDKGFGFHTADTVRICDRGKPDSLRRDFAEGSGPVEFLISLPRGKYDLLVISGDEAEESETHLSLPFHGVRLRGKRLAAGRYQCRILPVMHETDGKLALCLETGEGGRWKLNAIFVNRQYALL